MRETVRVSRRVFLKGMVGAGVGLVVGVRLPGGTASSSAPEWVRLGTWIRISPDDRVTIMVSRCEMGQGIATALSMIAAEELEADWSKIRTRWAPPLPEYGDQNTGASRSVRLLWEPLRHAGAVARELLISAAARQWGVKRETCVAEEGKVRHLPTGRIVRYGALAEAAARLPLPKQISLKSPDRFRIIGKSPPRLDARAKITGKAVFGWDVRLPGMLVAVLARCPVLDGEVVEYDEKGALSVPGVRCVIPVWRWGGRRRYWEREPSGSRMVAVAVVAEHTRAALLGREALRVRWKERVDPDLTTDGIYRTFFQWTKWERGEIVVHRGDWQSARSRCDRILRAEYRIPYLAHVPMEPMSCTAHVTEDRCEVWVPTQDLRGALKTAARYARLPLDRVRIHRTEVGGAFGRRLASDYVAEAVMVSAGVRAPVKVLWTREDDVRHDLYRPASVHVVEAGLDREGRPLFWRHRIAGEGSWIQLALGVDFVPYAVPNKFVDLVRKRGSVPLRTGAHRSVSHAPNAFVAECFLDDLARAAGVDPFEFRRRLLIQAPRYRRVLEAAAEKGRWNAPLPPGCGRGIAIQQHESGGLVAVVAEVSLEEEVRVHRLVCAVDCGQVIHPMGVESQIVGGAVFGLSGALQESLTVKGGRVLESNFHDYPILRMDRIPDIEVHILPSHAYPCGVGEAAVPPVAPAVANAVYALTGTPVRSLPIRV